MVTINYTPSRAVALYIGRQMENEAREVVIDLSGFISNYGEGTAVLVHQRPGDAAPYIVNAAQDGSTLTWTVTNTDTAFAGRGEAELRWMVGDVLAKSVVFPTRIKKSITADETIPDALQSWYDAMIEYLDTRFDGGGSGTDGVTFTPSVSAAGVISWTNDGGLENPDPVNIKGPQGETGATGAAGATGATGADGTTFTPAVSSAGVISWTNDGGLANPASVDLVAAVINALPSAVGVSF